MIAEQLLVDDAADAELRDRIKQFLASQHFASFRKLDVIVLGDSVILQGFVPNFHERQLAVVLCQRVAGVHRVVDRIIVPEGVTAERPADFRSPAVVSVGNASDARGLAGAIKCKAFDAAVRQSADGGEMRRRPK